MTTTWRAIAAGCALMALAACVDSPESFASSADNGDPLALTFDELAQQAAASGDASRAEGFTYAAIAARSGIAPSRFEVRTGSGVEAYEAFVSAISWQVSGAVALRVPAHRSVTAWRRTPDGVTRILSMTTPSDSAAVLNPMSLNPAGPLAAAFAGASALYQERRKLNNGASGASSDVFFLATRGVVMIREVLTGAACPRPSSAAAFKGITCQQAQYNVRFDVTMQAVQRRPYEVIAGGEVRRFWWPGDQKVAGYKLTFSCAVVNSATGC
ncbi:MAG: hypothetical protein IT361_09515 [Gemmatimonadaceae bacterium]|nr:hypothetical protein [Gemmatimonadaceae bacterium]